ncbi:MAG TPA: glycosyltransferase family 4 protein [Egibacteraceae bacterium]|nr:glycosyltransferase family 4 protein [Egibacteraceae bacterium]
MSTPRTLWVTNDFPPRLGGIETFVSELVSRLDPAGVRVLAAAAPGDAEHDADLPFPVERIGRRPLLPTPAVTRRVRAAAAAHAADVVVFGASWPLGELAGDLDVPTFALTHGHEAGMVRVGLGPLLRRVARRVDGLGVISRFTRAALEPWVAAHTAVYDLPPGVDTDRFHPGVDGSRIRERLHLCPDDGLVVCVGRLVARKGHDVLVDAWPRVRARHPGAHLLLCGGGPAGARLGRRAAALGVEGAVTLAGPVGTPDLPAVHAAADVFAMPCRTRLGGLDVEGLGIVYLEAQATGTPVVAGRSGGAPETLVDGRTGLVVGGRAPAELADALSALLGDGERRRAMGAAGRAFMEQRYAWPVIAERFRGILETIAGARTHR